VRHEKILIVSILALLAGLSTLYLRTLTKNEIVLFPITAKHDVFYFEVSCFSKVSGKLCAFSPPAVDLVDTYCKTKNCLTSQRMEFYQHAKSETLVSLTRSPYDEIFSIKLCEPVYGSYNASGISLAISFALFAPQIEDSYKIQSFGGFDVFENARDESWMIARFNEPPRHICAEEDQKKLEVFLKRVIQSQV